jgi:ferredoxin--NADP+ reductase
VEMDEVEKDLKSNIEAMKLIAKHEKKGVARKLNIKFYLLQLRLKKIAKLKKLYFRGKKLKIVK